ncbi:MAG: YHYH protein [Candidatus Sumerlaeaceae bacterium]
MWPLKQWRLVGGLALLLVAPALFAHDLSGDAEHPHYDWSVRSPGADGVQNSLLAQAGAGQLRSTSPPSAVLADPSPIQAAPFKVFAPKVGLKWDKDYLYVESNGLPSHNMMVGITAWQQQVPLPQSYVGDNAWRIPLHPVVAAQPVSIRGRFLRGAIALAANGVPIFNPQNNRGEIAQEIGELDQWKGHCGRADDYHYHAAPLHLQSVLGTGLPIAYALDGFPIYGLTEPDGSAITKLDEFNGHEAGSGYHYHASTKYPYVNGGFHGEVFEREGQVDPQPKGVSIRGGGAPLRGATITAFETTGTSSFKLSYELNGDKRAIVYHVNPDGTYPFEYWADGRIASRQVYTRRQGAGGEPPRPDDPARRETGRGQARASGEPDRSGRMPRGEAGANERKLPPGELGTTLPAASSTSSFVLGSPVVINGGALPVEFTGDGAGSTPPLAWHGAPQGTKSYALIMHHLDSEGKTKIYWTLFNIPPDVTHLDKNAAGAGTPGLSGIQTVVNYAPTHSKGPGAKTYVITLYALSEMLLPNVLQGSVNTETLVTAIKERILATASLSVTYSRRVP